MRNSAFQEVLETAASELRRRWRPLLSTDLFYQLVAFALLAPPLSLRWPDDPVTFKVRSFRTKEPGETWDFGDGTPPVTVTSDGNADQHAPNGYAEAIHKYAKAGHYLVKVEHVSNDGVKAVARLQVRVDKE